jgi:hypothetical protein
MYRNIATNRGQWIREKWYIKNKKGYLKIHIVVVNVKTKKILSMKVTTDDEHVMMIARRYRGWSIMPWNQIKK